MGKAVAAKRCKRRRVEITWVDACSDREGWQPMGGERAKPLCQTVFTVGYLVVETPEYVQVAQSVDAELDMTAERITVPRGVIRRIEKL